MALFENILSTVIWKGILPKQIRKKHENIITTSLQHLQNENWESMLLFQDTIASILPQDSQLLQTLMLLLIQLFCHATLSGQILCPSNLWWLNKISKMPSATVGSTKLQFFCPKKTKTNFKKLVEANVWRTAFWPGSINAETLCRVRRLGDGAAGGDCGLPSSGGGGAAGGATSSFQCQKWPEMVGTCDDCHDNTTDPRKSRLKIPSTEVPAGIAGNTNTDLRVRCNFLPLQEILSNHNPQSKYVQNSLNAW